MPTNGYANDEESMPLIVASNSLEESRRFDAGSQGNCGLSHLCPRSYAHPSAKIQRPRPVRALPSVNTRSAPGHPHDGIQLLETLLVSTTVVALGEIGDKTQLLA